MIVRALRIDLDDDLIGGAFAAQRAASEIGRSFAHALIDGGVNRDAHGLPPCALIARARRERSTPARTPTPEACDVSRTPDRAPSGAHRAASRLLRA
jgi:hypothetical protein